MKILCFGAHPDDLEIGMGGTISKLIKNDDKLFGFIMRECTGIRLEEQKKAFKILKLKFRDFKFSFEDGTMLEIGVITNLIKIHKPDRVYIPWVSDSNQHHRELARYVLSALRRTNVSCYMYGPTTVRGMTIKEFKPQVYEDISKEFKTKIKAISCHKSQIKKVGKEYLEYVKHKDAQNGYEIGVKYAEVFQIIKEIKG